MVHLHLLESKSPLPWNRELGGFQQATRVLSQEPIFHMVPQPSVEILTDLFCHVRDAFHKIQPLKASKEFYLVFNPKNRQPCFKTMGSILAPKGWREDMLLHPCWGTCWTILLRTWDLRCVAQCDLS